jgi:hypothetical protein
LVAYATTLSPSTAIAIVMVLPSGSGISAMNVADSGITAAVVAVSLAAGASSLAPLEHAANRPSVMTAPAATTSARVYFFMLIQPPLLIGRHDLRPHVCVFGRLVPTGLAATPDISILPVQTSRWAKSRRMSLVCKDCDVAESRWFASQGFTLVNMTEAVLARELEICYAAVALVTGLDAGIDAGSAVSAVDVFAEFERNLVPFKKLVFEAIDQVELERACTHCLPHEGAFDLP